MAFVDVAAADDLVDGIPHIVSVGRRELVLLRWEEHVYALRNVCPHQTQSFAGGVVHGRIDAAGVPGQITVRHDAPTLTCPWHHWEFDVRSGRCPIDAKLRIRPYATVVEDGRVLVDLTRNPNA